MAGERGNAISSGLRTQICDEGGQHKGSESGVGNWGLECNYIWIFVINNQVLGEVEFVKNDWRRRRS